MPACLHGQLQVFTALLVALPWLGTAAAARTAAALELPAARHAAAHATASSGAVAGAAAWPELWRASVGSVAEPGVAAPGAAAVPPPRGLDGVWQSRAAQLTGAEAFDFYLLALLWPPATLPAALHGRARQLLVRHEAHAGYWTHGLWPVGCVPPPALGPKP
jgi:ribonuclease I